MKAVVTVTLKPEVLDPEGRAVQKAARSLGYEGVGDVRQGKHFELALEARDEDEARRLAGELAEKLLANPVIEDYRVERIEP